MSARNFATGTLKLNGYTVDGVILNPGDTLLIVSRSGSGKTLAAHQMAKLRQSKTNSPAESKHLVPPGASISFMPNDPSLLFSCLTKSVRREIEIGYQFLGLHPPKKEVLEMLDKFDLIQLSEQDPFSLSGGEQIRLSLALALTKKPAILISDCILEQLDPESETLLLGIIGDEQRKRGLINIEFHSRAPRASREKEVCWLFAGESGVVSGRLEECWRPVSIATPDLLSPALNLAAKLSANFGINYLAPPLTPRLVAEPLTLHSNEILATNELLPKDHSILRAEGLEFKYEGKHAFQLGPIALELQKGSTTALLGKNGSGKTTLLKCLGNLNSGWSGRIWLGEQELRTQTSLSTWAKSIIYCFQNPDHQIYLPTIGEEIKETARRTRGEQFPIDARVNKVTALLELPTQLSRSPMDLPFSMRRLLTLAGAFIATPEIILLDEPTVGLDLRQAENLMHLIRDYINNGGTLAVISHDYDFVTEIADKVVILSTGNIASIHSRGEPIEWPGRFSPIVPAVAQELGLSAIWRECELKRQLAPSNQDKGAGGRV